MAKGWNVGDLTEVVQIEIDFVNEDEGMGPSIKFRETGSPLDSDLHVSFTQDELRAVRDFCTRHIKLPEFPK